MGGWAFEKVPGGFSKLGIVCAPHSVMEPYLPFAIFWGVGLLVALGWRVLLGLAGLRADEKKPSARAGRSKAKLVIRLSS